MSKKVIDTEGYNAVTQWKYGYAVYNKNDLYIGKAVEKYGEFSEFEIDLFRQICRPGDVVLEVGANIGTHTVALSNIVGEHGLVYALEPQPIIFYTLCANVAINSLSNVHCLNLAAGATEGFVLIPNINYEEPGNYGSIEVDKFKKGNQIRRVRLDNHITVPSLRLLKIDVEGMESEVIRGAKKLISRHNPVIYVENDRPEKSKALIELIRSLDYRMYWHQPLLYNPNNFFGDSENIYPNIVSINMLCFHKSVDVNLAGFVEIVDAELHPMVPRS